MTGRKRPRLAEGNCGQCGRPLIYAAEGETTPVCGGCQSKPDHCECTRELTGDARSGAWLHDQTFDPLACAVDGLIVAGLTVLAGAPKIGKSVLVLQTALDVARGAKPYGTLPAADARMVFYLALEDSDRRMQYRCRQLLPGGEPIPPLFFYQTGITPGMITETITEWMITHPATALVAVDTLGKVMPPALNGESPYDRDTRIGSALKASADAYRLPLLVAHHDRKAGAEDFVLSVSGTNGIAGTADSIMVLARPRTSDAGVLRATGRDIDDGEYALTLDRDGKTGWTLDGDGTLDGAADAYQKRKDSMTTGQRMAAILAMVRGAESGDISAAEVAAKFGPTTYGYLSRLAKSWPGQNGSSGSKG